MHKFELARELAWSDADYRDQRNKHDAKMRRRMSVLLRDAASVLLELMLAVPPIRTPTSRTCGGSSRLPGHWKAQQISGASPRQCSR